ncbi:helix-turn-helix transcriptional regulator [Lacticaseibacillus sp. N501-2]|uniref:helix-turn-helix transcriptional regulator n=1 Tax=Lacticaseibacillus salsurae TaxID=3367729 RepID=UPI0038B36F12
MNNFVIGDMLKRIRLGKGLTQPAVSGDVVSPRQLRSIEKGDHDPSLYVFFGLLANMHMSSVDLMRVIHEIQQAIFHHERQPLHDNGREHLFRSNEFYDLEMKILRSILNKCDAAYLEQVFPQVVRGLENAMKHSEHLGESFDTTVHIGMYLFHIGERHFSSSVANLLQRWHPEFSKSATFNHYLEYLFLLALHGDDPAITPEKIIAFAHLVHEDELANRLFKMLPKTKLIA